MTYQHILVPVDGSDLSLSVIQHAVSLAQAFNSKITVTQVLTLDPYVASEYLSAGQTNDLIERARQYILQNLEKAKAQFQALGLEVETTLLEGENISRTLTKAVETLNVDLIVLSSHGRSGIKKLLMGSVAQNLITEASVPVFVVKAQ